MKEKRLCNGGVIILMRYKNSTMIVANIQNGYYYFYDLLKLLVERDQVLYTQKQFEILLSENNYLGALEKLPENDMFYIIKKILQLIINYNSDYFDYRRYNNLPHYNHLNGNSPSKQIAQDIKQIEKYENILLNLYDKYIIFNEKEPQYFSNAPKDLIEHFHFIHKLKKNIQEKTTLENKYYYKTQKFEKPNLKKLEQYCIAIKTHYNLEWTQQEIKTFLKTLEWTDDDIKTFSYIN